MGRQGEKQSEGSVAQKWSVVQRLNPTEVLS